MFLSSRWGKPSYEIEALPLSEFNKQKVFWEHCKWGITDDLLAYHHNIFVMSKTGKQSTEVATIKSIAVSLSATKKFVIESTKGIRQALVGIAKSMKQRQTDQHNVPKVRPIKRRK